MCILYIQITQVLINLKAQTTNLVFCKKRRSKYGLNVLHITNQSFEGFFPMHLWLKFPVKGSWDRASLAWLAWHTELHLGERYILWILKNLALGISDTFRYLEHGSHIGILNQKLIRFILLHKSVQTKKYLKSLITLMAPFKFKYLSHHQISMATSPYQKNWSEIQCQWRY